MNRIKVHKTLFVIVGLLCLALGLIGVVLPVLPTTPFVLLAAALFIRSSDSLHRRLLASPLFGKYISDFSEKKGMTMRGKIYAISLMWTMIGLSIVYIDSFPWRVLLVLLGCVGTAAMGLIVRTVSREGGATRDENKDPE
ncbi:MAG: DUF454 domain-containing protein [Spirochaetae bacterium HGW-Spirochaetae-1]|jgi:hypothetical protein|nr:MAG: DUF454 domain-containing protein [Spirochaetae bacterium HGW-Spirochaetae-1]